MISQLILLITDDREYNFTPAFSFLLAMSFDFQAPFSDSPPEMFPLYRVTGLDALDMSRMSTSPPTHFLKERPPCTETTRTYNLGYLLYIFDIPVTALGQLETALPLPGP